MPRNIAVVSHYANAQALGDVRAVMKHPALAAVTSFAAIALLLVIGLAVGHRGSTRTDSAMPSIKALSVQPSWIRRFSGD